MELVRKFEQLNKNDAHLAGGKGASLGEMTQAGIPVPPGFVVLSDSFEQFIKETDLVQEIDAILHKVDHKQIHTVEAASEQIRELILNAKMPADIATEIDKSFKELNTKYVAVRSSATAEDGKEHAWAGQLESYLNTTEDQVLTKVKLCWSSLFTPRAIFYRFEKGLHSTKISVAVVVQKMVESEVSGIAFSVHPVTEDRNQLIIEAGFGLGEAIVSGSVTPDSYVVEKEPRNILDINISTQNRGLYRSDKTSAEHGNNEWQDIAEPKASSQVLTKEQILELSEIILNIERHYGFPCDIEWAYESGKFYIVQSRPITTLSLNALPKDVEKSVILSKIYSREKALFYFCVWRDSDIEGVRNFLDGEIKNILFIIPPHGQNGEVWYDVSELERFTRDAIAKINNDTDLREKIIKNLKNKWDSLKTYFEGGNELKNIDEAMVYSRNLIEFWTSINSVFFELPNLSEVNADFSKQILEMRVATERYTDKMSTKFIDFFERTFPKFAHLSHFVTPDDVRKISDNPEDQEFISTLEKRAEAGCFMLNNEVCPMEELSFILQTQNIVLKKEDIDSFKEIKGSIGYKGVVSGAVKVILGKKDITKIKEGDILVASMTNPEFVPYMEKAAAFITDEGGVTCHAAIVAREMKKPCVIGTKIATQVLKDGDLVEVDADNGIVRIIKNEDNDLGDIFLEKIGDKVLYPPLNSYSAFIQGSEYNIDKYFSKWYGGTVSFDLLLLMKEGFSQVWLSETDLKNASIFVFKEFLQKPNDFDKRIEFFYNNIKEIDKIYNHYSYEKINQSNWEELIPLVDQIRDLIWDANAAVIFSIYLDQKLAWEILNTINYPISKDELDQIWPRAVEPAFESFDKAQTTHILALLEKGKDIHTITEDCQYILTDYYSARSLDVIKGTLLERHGQFFDNSKKVINFIKQEKSEISNLEIVHKEWLDSLEKNKRKIAEYLQVVMKTRDRRKNFFAKGLTIIYRIAEKMFTEVGVSSELIPYYTMRELVKGVDYLRSHKQELGDRKNGLQLFIPNDDQVVIKTSPIESIVEEVNGHYILSHQKTIPSDIGVITGQVGSKGVVKGVVRIVLNAFSEHGFKDGEILVTGMTSPEYVPLMKKAGGIITDEGGITCHAAIVSRELGVPCVIGTKIATKTLKDGDVVEVDADNGIVRIIEEKS